MHTAMAALLLTARLYSLVDVPAGDRVAATVVAGNILRSAGIDMMWTDCNQRPSSDRLATNQVCLTPPRTDEVMVRVVAAPASASGSQKAGMDTLGDAYVDTAAASGSLATVYVDRVALMAHSAGIDTGTLLGRVMAHEIGHLLLGTATHRASGLMRAEWSAALLQRRMANDWRLSRPDAAQARAGLLRRTTLLSAHPPAATLPCAALSMLSTQAICPSCPVCATLLPADRMSFDLLVEPRF
jgi:hypothetical protein